MCERILLSCGGGGSAGNSDWSGRNKKAVVGGTAQEHSGATLVSSSGLRGTKWLSHLVQIREVVDPYAARVDILYLGSIRKERGDWETENGEDTLLNLKNPIPFSVERG